MPARALTSIAHSAVLDRQSDRDWLRDAATRLDPVAGTVLGTVGEERTAALNRPA
jgi:hypothetical protein